MLERAPLCPRPLVTSTIPPWGVLNSSPVTDFDTSQHSRRLSFRQIWDRSHAPQTALRGVLVGDLACPGSAQGGCPLPASPFRGSIQGSLNWAGPTLVPRQTPAGRGRGPSRFPSSLMGLPVGESRSASQRHWRAGHNRNRLLLPWRHRDYAGAVGRGPDIMVVCADSEGVPAEPALTGLELALGTSPDLQVGRIRTDTCSLPVPYDHAWLVVIWPDGPEIVQLAPTPQRQGKTGYARIQRHGWPSLGRLGWKRVRRFSRGHRL